MRSNNASGFTLVPTLIFMHLFVLLSLFTLSRSSLDMKENQQRLLSFEFRMKARATLQQLERMSRSQWQSCLISSIAATALVNKSVDWWQNKGCHFVNTDSYYYTIEPLGNDPWSASVYYRITLFARSAKLSSANYFLQSTVALQDSSPPLCEGNQRQIIWGPQVRREI